MSEDKNIYKMKLHAVENLANQMSIIRVPGGWIYESFTEQVGGHFHSSMCFVPFDNEYMKSNDSEPFNR